MPRLQGGNRKQWGMSQSGKLNAPRFKVICLLLATYATSTGWETCTTYEGRDIETVMAYGESIKSEVKVGSRDSEIHPTGELW